MLNTKEIQENVRRFASEREWERFHTPKNLAMALNVEAGELLELFQWLTPEESARIMEGEKAQDVRHEMADVLVYLLRLADVLGVDLKTAVEEKMRHNAQKYPVEKARGNARKYDEL